MKDEIKFKDIKKGDTVYVKSRLYVSWGISNSFWLPKIVNRTTKTQFIIGEDRYRKTDGKVIGAYLPGQQAKKKGDYDQDWQKCVKDETEAMEKMANKINLAKKANNIILKMKIHYDCEHLEEIIKKLQEVEKLLRGKSV